MHFKYQSKILKIYVIASALTDPIYDLVHRYRLLKGKEERNAKTNRFGTAEIERPKGPLIWFHAASLGESLAVLPLIDKLLSNDKDLNVLLTTQTLTSARILKQRLPPRAIHQVAPYDTDKASTRFLNHWKPDLAVWTEGDLWPTIMLKTKQHGIPMALVNARVSSNTIKKWRRWPRAALDLLGLFDRICVQEEALASVLKQLNVDPKKLTVTGSLKADSPKLAYKKDTLADLTQLLEGRSAWLASATHQNEDEVIVSAHQQILQNGDPIRPLLIITPRHPERGAKLARKLRDQGWRVKVRSDGEKILTDTEIYVADTLGELGLWYRLCPIAFIGGTLVPKGGHNPYEPAQLNCAIVHGQHTENFAQIYKALDTLDGAIRAVNAQEISNAVLRLQDEGLRKKITLSAHDVLMRTQPSSQSITLQALRALQELHDKPLMNQRPNIDDVSVIAPNLKYRLSGVTSTVVRLIPLQAKEFPVAATGPGLPDEVPQVSLWSLIFMSRSGPQGWRIWHARRNTEMVLGLILRNLLKKRLKLIFTSASQRKHTYLTRCLINSMDAVVATSEKSQSYLKVPAQVVYHGIDTTSFSPITNKRTLRAKLGLPIDGKLIGCFGRIRHQKGTDLFLETAISLCQQHKDLYAIILGRALPKDKDFLQSLKLRLKQTGLQNRILFYEEVTVSEMANWYRAIDLYVAPQRWEGFGLTPLEAMACGVPVVAADVGAFRNLIIHGETGLIVPKDSLADLCEATNTLLEDSEKLSSYGVLARSHTSTKFDIKGEATSLLNLYKDLLTSGAK